MRFPPKVKVMLVSVSDGTILDDFVVRSENDEVRVSHKVRDLIGRYYDVSDEGEEEDTGEEPGRTYVNPDL